MPSRVIESMFRTSRDKVATFDSRHALIHERCRMLLEQNHRLCNVLVAANEPLAVGRQSATAAAGFPWMTPVLGSGLTAEHNHASVVTELAQAAVATLGDRDRWLAAGFARGLIRQRLPTAPDVDVSAEVETAGDGPSELGALLLAVAAITRAYHRIQAEGTPVHGLGHEALAELDADNSYVDEIQRDFVDPALRAIDAALTVCSSSKVEPVLRQASHGLSPRRGEQVSVSVVTIRALTEYCWRLMGASLYPGWSDLLWSLFMLGPDWPPVSERRGPRPLAIQLSDAAKSVKERFEELTSDSWSPAAVDQDDPGPRFEVDGDAGSETESVHAAIARCLIAQSAYRGSLVPVHRPPPASAFVTTFDLELEMSFLRLGAEFVMALPMNVTSSTDRALVWVGCHVSPGPEPDLDCVLEPDDAKWFLLSNMSQQFKRSSYSDMPVVVRLAGSPLVARPDLTAASALDAEIRALTRFEDYELTHAVLLDEFVALDQAAALLGSVPSPTGVSKDAVEYSLPEVLSCSDLSLGYTRFWMLLGVQTGDPAIRHSIGMQLALRGTRRSSSQPVPLRNGLAIQRDVSGEAEDLMHQIGLDVVEGWMVDPFVKDIVHYAEHVEHARDQLDGGKPAEGAGMFPSSANESCRLPAESR